MLPYAPCFTLSVTASTARATHTGALDVARATHTGALDVARATHTGALDVARATLPIMQTLCCHM